MMSVINDMVFRVKEEILSKVMKQYLQTDIVAECDIKRFQLITHFRYPGIEFITIDGNVIGKIFFDMVNEDNMWILKYKFEPQNGYLL